MVRGLVGDRATTMLVDTGSAVTILLESVWREAGAQLELTPATRPVVAANGKELEVIGQSMVTIHVGGLHVSHCALIARGVTQECLLGADFLVQHGCIVDLRAMTLSAGGESSPLLFRSRHKQVDVYCVSIAKTTTVPARHQMPIPARVSAGKGTVARPGVAGMLEPEPNFTERHDVLVAHSLSSMDAAAETLICVLNPSPVPVTIRRGERVGQLLPLDDSVMVHQIQVSTTTPSSPTQPVQDEIAAALREMESGTEGLTPQEMRRLHVLLESFHDVVATKASPLGRTSKVQHQINTGDAPPVRQPPRRLPFHQRGDVHRMMGEMLEKGVIEETHGPWSSPIVLVGKKDGTTRFCVDFRKVNELTKKDAHPLPRMDETLDMLSGAKWFSTLDLASGYWQVEVDPADREKTAFSTPFGLYQFRVMPFGLCNAPSTFQRLMELVLSGLHWTTCLVYLDDICLLYTSPSPRD